MIRRAVIDSGPLFSALVIHHALSPLTRMDRTTLLGEAHESVRSSQLQARFLGVLAGISEKLTTSHAIGEVNGLISTRLNLKGPERERFWNGSIDLLTLWGMDERLVALLDYGHTEASAIHRIGLVDTGLIRLAQASNCMLITHDEKTLYGLALERGVRCELVRNLL